MTKHPLPEPLAVLYVTLDGTGEQLLGDDRVKRAYLGED